VATHSDASLDLWTPADILLRLATHRSDRTAAIYARHELLQERVVAQQELDESFNRRFNAIAIKELELDFLDHIQVFDGTPVYFHQDESGLTTSRTFTTPTRTAIFKSTPGESTLGINAGQDDFRSFHFPSASLAHGHALRWLVDGVLPPESHAVEPPEPSPSDSPALL
jgi:hypothetical protein